MGRRVEEGCSDILEPECLRYCTGAEIVASTPVRLETLFGDKLLAMGRIGRVFWDYNGAPTGETMRRQQEFQTTTPNLT